MIKRIVTLVSCLLVLTAAIFPAQASSYEGPDDINPRRYYALIPYTSKSVTVGSCVFHSGADSLFFDFAPGYENEDYPTRSPISSDQVGWDLDGDLNVLHTDFVTEYYTNESNYYAAFNRYAFKADGSTPKSLKVSFVAEDFHITSAEWAALVNNALLYLPSAATVRVSFDVVYYSMGSDGKTFTMHNGSSSALVSSSGPESVKFYPSFSSLFKQSGALINSGYSVGRLVMTLEFDNYPGDVGVGMLYGLHNYDTEDFGVIETTKEVIVEKEVVKVVPAEELDLFSWIIAPLGSFFQMELYPGISLGGIIGILAVVLIVVFLIKVFG